RGLCGRHRGRRRTDRLGRARLPRPEARARRSRGAWRDAALGRDQGARMTAMPQPSAKRDDAGAPRPLRLTVLIPLVLFFAGAVLFFCRSCSADPPPVPSALIGHPAPAPALPPIDGLVRDGKPVPGLAVADFAGTVTVMNVWASWCVPCHDEAPLLMRLAADKRIRVVGIDQKDNPENARRFLGRYGNPYAARGADHNGRASIEWGVYGVPENFIIGRDGKIAYKLVGQLTADNLERVVKPEIEKALAAGS